MDNTDYKELYLKMMRASGGAINALIEVQWECEELYLSMGDKKKDTEVIKDKTDG